MGLTGASSSGSGITGAVTFVGVTVHITGGERRVGVSASVVRCGANAACQAGDGGEDGCDAWIVWNPGLRRVGVVRGEGFWEASCMG